MQIVLYVNQVFAYPFAENLKKNCNEKKFKFYFKYSFIFFLFISTIYFNFNYI